MTRKKKQPSYVQTLAAAPTQMEQANSRQVLNNAGGYVYTTDLMSRVMRFLILGVAGNTYYTNRKKLLKERSKDIDEALRQDYRATIDLIVEVSVGGRAVKNDPAVFALAQAASFDTANVRAYALTKLEQVCRIPTHLFQFVEAVNSLRKWSRQLRNSVGKWYTDKIAEDLAYVVLKYQQREGWSHADVLRLCHTKPKTLAHEAIFRKICDKDLAGYSNPARNTVYADVRQALPELFGIRDQLLSDITEEKQIELIKTHNISWEMLPTDCLKSPRIWNALLFPENGRTMPLTALIRNLGRMSSIGVFEQNPENKQRVIAQLTDEELLQKARIHPLNALVALKTYSSNQGVRGSLTWDADQDIVKALEKAYYLSFRNVESTGKRFFMGVDVSASMSSNIAGLPISSAEAAAALAMLFVRTEPWATAYGFCDTFVDLEIDRNTSLLQAAQSALRNNFRGTDCSLPMLYALEHNIPVDVFVVITDNETWAGKEHPDSVLRRYRKQMGIDARLIVLATEASEFTIADPADPGMLDIAGFDTAVPQVISEFCKLNIRATTK